MRRRNIKNNVKFSQLFIKFLKSVSLKNCLINDKNCEGKGICSHTIQNSIIMDELAIDGHVYMIEYMNDQNICFKKFSRNEATTFTGFCAFHDNKIFKAIDFNKKSSLDSISSEQAALFAFRSLAQEYWKKLNNIKSLELLISAIKRKDKESIYKVFTFMKAEKEFDWSFFNLLFLESFLLGTKSATKYLRASFESILCQINKNKFHLTKNCHFVIDKKINFAVSTQIFPIHDFTDNVIDELIGLNIFPHKNTTHILLVWHRSSNLNQFIEQLLAMSGEELEINLSKFIIAHAENIIFSSKIVESFTDKEKENIFRIMNNCFEEVKLSRYPDINLFRKL